MDHPKRLKKDWKLSSDALKGLLSLLDADPERAGREYVAIRLRLIEFFRLRRCELAEELAEETLDRAARRINEGALVHAKPISYFLGIATRVLQEYYHQPRPTLLPPPLDPEVTEIKYECMRKCLSKLDSAMYEIINEYYLADAHARARLAERLGVSLNTLKIRVHRIKKDRLQKCLRQCIESERGRKII